MKIEGFVILWESRYRGTVACTPQGNLSPLYTTRRKAEQGAHAHLSGARIVPATLTIHDEGNDPS